MTEFITAIVLLVVTNAASIYFTYKYQKKVIAKLKEELSKI